MRKIFRVIAGAEFDIFQRGLWPFLSISLWFLYLGLVFFSAEELWGDGRKTVYLYVLHVERPL
jgi:hypothetical protein